MKVTIYGVGAIGGWIGARLALAGHAVSVVARGAALDALRRDGLALIEHGATQSVPVTASDDPAAIGREIGIPIDQDPRERHAVPAKLGAMRTSMLQDVEAGKPLEIDALVASVRELGGIVNVPTPFTDALLGLIRLRGRVLGLY